MPAPPPCWSSPRARVPPEPVDFASTFAKTRDRARIVKQALEAVQRTQAPAVTIIASLAHQGDDLLNVGGPRGSAHPCCAARGQRDIQAASPASDAVRRHQGQQEGSWDPPPNS
jgi:hypothetical protein